MSAPKPALLASALRSWQRDRSALSALFTADEVERLDAARQSMGPEGRRVAYCVFENPFAKAGGVFAVASHLGPALREAGDEVILLTPFHRNLASTPGYHEVDFFGEVLVRFAGHDIRCELFEHHDKLGNRWVMIQSWAIFDADGGPDRTNPYSYSTSWLQLRDALFFSAAVPHVLAHLGWRENVVVHAQDWQTAPLALTVKQAILDDTLDSAVTVLTSHNPYDHPLPDGNLSWITARLGPAQYPCGRDTVYQRMIPLTDGPLSTVSPTFARELTEDPLQLTHFAGHLQAAFRMQTIVGIDNPLFGAPQPAFSEKAVSEASFGRPQLILAEKQEQRRRMLKVLAEFDDPRTWGALDGGDGRLLVDLPEDVPVFMMFGRLDPGQKGFDVLARAIEGFSRGAARFILAPSVPAGVEVWAEDLRELARCRPGDVVVYPFRMKEGYMEAMAGATYAVMPSLYEPFGAATEAYLNGTPVVARATGGLVGQVDDFRTAAAQATGFLYREKVPLGASWPAIETAAGPQARVTIPLYAMIVEALYDTLNEAAALYHERRSVYGRMLAHLYPKAAAFSAERAAASYHALYDVAVNSE